MTENQQKLVKEILGNFGNKGFTKTMTQMMIDSGYSKESAREQSNILVGIKDEFEPVLKQLETKRQLAIREINSDKLSDAKARDLAYIVDILTKNIQLLSGGETEIVKIYGWDKYDKKPSNNLSTESMDSEVPREQSKVEDNRSSQESG